MSLKKAFRIFPPGKGEKIVLRCFSPDCDACSRYYNLKKYKTRFEKENGITNPLPWDCSVPEFRDYAIDNGVKKLPSYLVFEKDGSVNVLYPSLSSSS